MTERDIVREKTLAEIIWERDQMILNLLEEIKELRNRVNDLERAKADSTEQ